MVYRPVTSEGLIGRTEALAALLEQMARVTEGQGQVALLVGPAGIGKTRLVGEVARRAADAGFAVAVGHCDELDRSLPLAPLIELLRAKPGLPADALPELAAVLPELATVRPSPPRDDRSLIRAVARGVASLAGDGPLLAVVEDLHWCDESSLAALSHIVHQAARLRLFVVLTSRPDPGAPELSGLLATLAHLPHAQECKLAALTLEETATLIARLAGSVGLPPQRLSERVQLITDGNPLFVEEVVGALRLDAAEKFPEPGEVDHVPVPRSVQAAVWQRCRDLSAPARRLLQLAAVAGRRADVNVLAEVAHLDEPTLVALLRELLSTTLVLEESADRIAFGHELTRRAVLADLLARERRSLHLVIAEALERREGDGASSAELAHHYWEAEVWGKSRDYAARAGRHALALGAPGAAVDLLTAAIEASTRLGQRPPAQTLRARAGAHERLGQFELSLADLDATLQLARAERDRKAECAAMLDLGSLWTGRDYATAGDFFRRGLDVARSLQEPGVLPAALNRVGNWHLNSERPDQARRHHAEALDRYRAAGDGAGMAATSDFLATVELTVGDLAIATRSYGEAVTGFRALRDTPALASALAMQTFTAPQYLGWPATWTGSIPCDAALRSGQESVELCRTISWRSGQALGHVALASVLGEHGHYDEALGHARAATELAEEAGHPYWVLLARLVLGAIYLDLLAVGDGRREAEAAFELAAHLGSDYWRRTATGFLVDACLLDGDRAAARAAVDTVPPGEAPNGTTSLTMGLRHLWRGRAELALADNDHATAGRIVEGMRAVIARTGHPGPRFELLRGRALAAAGKHVEAEETWRSAIEEAERRDVLPVAWRLHAALGRGLRAKRRLDDADGHLAAARRHIDQLARALADPTARALFADAASARLARPTPRRAAKQFFGGLTLREQEVAALVAQGLTNPEIANHLVVSPRTVEKHVEHALAKLGMSTRAGVATWAVGVGLADAQKIRESWPGSA